MNRFLIVIGLLFTAVAAHAAPLPVDTLDGDSTTVPDGLAPGPRLLVVAFSRAAQKQTKDWETHLVPLCGTGKLSCYDVSVIERMPSFVTEMVVGQMRDSTPVKQQDHYLLVMKGTADWEALTQAPPKSDDGYLVLFGADGKVLWRGHGAWSAGTEAALTQALPKAP